MSAVISSLDVFKSFPGLMLIFCQFVDAASLYFQKFKLDFVFSAVQQVVSQACKFCYKDEIVRMLQNFYVIAVVPVNQDVYMMFLVFMAATKSCGARLSSDLQKHCKLGDSSAGDMWSCLNYAVSHDGGESVIHKTSNEVIQ